MKSLLYLLSLFLFAYNSTAVFASPAAFTGSSDVSIARRAFKGFGSVGDRETNAQRMARGLGPKKPGRLFSPTRAFFEFRTLPALKLTGRNRCPPRSSTLLCTKVHLATRLYFAGGR